MIDSTGFSSLQFQIQQRSVGLGANSLTQGQSQLINETLSQFNANSLTESDARAIVSTFSEAGIRPGKELAKAMEEAGFDAKTVGELAGVSPPPPPSSGGQREQNSGLQVSLEQFQEIVALMDEYYSQQNSFGFQSTNSQSTLQSTIENMIETRTRIFSTTA